MTETKNFSSPWRGSVMLAAGKAMETTGARYPFSGAYKGGKIITLLKQKLDIEGFLEEKTRIPAADDRNKKWCWWNGGKKIC